MYGRGGVGCFVFCTDDRKCRVWDLEAGKLLSEFQLKSPCVEVAWHPLEPMKV